MKIMVCESCGRFIHRDARCIHCGGANLYPAEYEQSIHPAAAKDFAEMNRLLAAGEFDRVTELADRVQEWMSFTSEVHWMRLLARNRCSTDLELICRGADLDAGGSYYNAVKYAEPEEHQVYLDVRDKLESVQAMLREKTQRHFQEQQRLAAPDPSGLDEQVEAAKAQLLELWNELNDVENQIRILDGECRAAFRPHRETLSAAQKEAETIRRQLDQTKECDEQTGRTYQIRIAAALQMSEEAAGEMRAMLNDHPWANKYQELKERRDRCESSIRRKVMELKDTTRAAERALSELERLRREENEALVAIDGGSFAQARQLLGEETFVRVLNAAGIAV